MADFIHFHFKLSQIILYDLFIFIIIINHLCIQFKKIKKKWLPLPGFEPLTPRYAKKDENMQKTTKHEQGLNQGPQA